jgi:hypothetical protein
MSDWLDLRLAHELRPVQAPAELWGRVRAGQRPPVTRSRWWTLRLPVLASAALLIAAGLLWSAWRSAGLEKLAVRELDRSAQLELRSSDPLEIGAWLRREAGVDVEIPVSRRIRLTGARVIRQRGTLVGEVAYRVGGDSALLLVAPAGGAFRAPGKHGGFAWQKQQQVYAIACSLCDRPQAACALCHANL